MVLMISAGFVSLFTIFLSYVLGSNLLGAATYKFNYYASTELSGFNLDSFFKFLVIMYCGAIFLETKLTPNGIACWYMVVHYMSYSFHFR